MVNKDALSQARTIVRYAPAPQRRGRGRVHHLSDNIVRRRLTKGQSAMAMAYPEPKRGVHPELKNSTGASGFEGEPVGQPRAAANRGSGVVGRTLNSSTAWRRRSKFAQMKSRGGSVMSVSSVDEPLRDSEDLDTARRRAATERRATEITRRNQEWANFDWASLWRMLDQRILETLAAQDIFTENQREVLATVVSDACGEIGKTIDKTIGDLKGAYDAKLEALERRVRAPGTLPRVKVWKHGMVTYEGELASFGGSLYQARADTGLEPGDPEAWTCVARAGKDASQVIARGEWTASASYGLLSLVAHQGCSYLATRDDPGEPGAGGSGWQAIAAKGAKGDSGPRGPRGDRGARGAAETPVTIRAWSLDVENYRARPALSNGEVGAILDLRPFFEAFGYATGTT